MSLTGIDVHVSFTLLPSGMYQFSIVMAYKFSGGDTFRKLNVCFRLLTHDENST
ncbi:hypothetical protein BDV23DRAFT_151064 [Aspergillus alliaceus]|uniref:Uncharacterized protein n=1 Tax=Petromyces alliaceus TaxID=209559 RepID=A0A5N7CEL3_PETAA|nr:hypothetical protein BDV23DRAFT_151064 [Aspergillus alliaceus]